MATAPSGERISLAAALNVARIERHMSIRAAALVAGVPPATVQGWLNGRYFPTPALQGEFSKLVVSFGLEDRLTSTLWMGVDEAHVINSARQPYLGLSPYRASDSELYFGRDAERERLARAVLAARMTASPVVVVVGGSGSGKSSLLGAGLAGHECLRSGLLAGWSPRFLRLDELPRAVATAPVDREIWILDQIEDGLAEKGIEPLASLGSVPSGVVVVVAVRSDAFARLAEVPALIEPTSRPFVIRPMTRTEVREVLLRPCERLGGKVEESLVDLVLRDAGLSSGRNGTLPVGVLPLLSNALMVTWANRRADGVITSADYLAIGGLPGSVNTLAEKVYGQLPESSLDLVQSTFLTLVQIDKSAVRRRSLDLADLTPDQLLLLEPFIDERLVSVSDASTLQISHDALLTIWDRLADWIAEDCDQLRVLDLVRHAAQAWGDHERSDHLLLPLNRVPALQDILAGPPGDALLTALERDFLTASQCHFATRLQVEQRTSRRLRRQRTVISAVLVVAIALTWATSHLYLTSQSVQLAAQSRQVADDAESLRGKDPNLRAQMALTASALSDTLEGRSALLDVGAVDVPTRWLGVGSATVAASRDGRVVVRGDGGGGLTVWHQDELVSSPGTRVIVNAKGDPLYGVAVERVGSRYLAAVAGPAVTAVWDVTGDPVQVHSVSGDSTAYAAAMSPDGMVAFGGDADTSVWKVAGGTASAVATIPVRTRVLAFGQNVLYAAGDRQVFAWRLSGGTVEPEGVLSDTGATGSARIQALAVSSDGHQLAAAYTVPRVARWNLPDRAPVAPLAVGTSSINGLAYSPDGTTLAVASSDQHAYLVSSADGSTTRQLSDPSKVSAVAWSGSSVVTSGIDGTVRLWQEKSPILRWRGKAIRQFASDVLGRRWLAGATSGQISLWRVDGHELVEVPAPQVPDGFYTTTALAISPDGSRMCAGTRTGAVITWDLTPAGAENARIDHIMNSGAIRSISFDATGDLLAVAPSQGQGVEIMQWSADKSWRDASSLDADTPMSVAFDPERPILTLSLARNQVEVWDMSDPASPSKTATIPTDATPSVQITGHGGLLVVGTDVGTVRVWDVSDPHAPVLVQEHKDALSAIYGLAITPDANTLAAASADGLLWVWNLKDKTVKFELDGSLDSAYDTGFIAGGDVLAATGESGTVRMWTMDPATVKSDLCHRLGDPLTRDESIRYLPGASGVPACAR